MSLICASAFARPEYALERSSNCTMCHVLPTGAGPRTMAGKIFGSKLWPPADSSRQDLIYADFRAEYLQPEIMPATKTNGLGLMVSALSVNYPVYTHEHSSLRFVATHEMGTLASSAGSREQVVLWGLSSPSRFMPNYIMVGKFYQPFGILTDEHRTYTKMMYPSAVRDFEMGVMAAWDLKAGFHLDLAATNGFQSAGGFTSNEETRALIGNLRWISNPLMFGFSYARHTSEHKANQTPEAKVAYYGFNLWKLFLTGEVLNTIGWNDNTRVGGFFYGPSGSAYKATVDGKSAIGFQNQLRYNWSDNLAFLIRFDQYTPDIDRTGDSFLRTGFGTRWYFDSNASIDLRYESTQNRIAPLQSDTSKANDNIYFAHFRFWL